MADDTTDPLAPWVEPLPDSSRQPVSEPRRRPACCREAAAQLGRALEEVAELAAENRRLRDQVEHQAPAE